MSDTIVEDNRGGGLAARPPVQYAHSTDVTIAYQTLGHGQTSLVFLPGYYSHLELNWEQPLLAWFLRSLASFSRLVLFDGRGTGLSDRGVAPPTLEERMKDILAVLESVEIDRAAFFGISEGGALGACFAAHYPQRTSKLVLFNSFGRLRWARDYPWGWGRERLQAFIGNKVPVERFVPSLTGDDLALDWAGRYMRSAVSPGMWAELMRQKSEIDIRDAIGSVTAPTLVLCRSHDQLIQPAHSRYLAECIPSARLVELPGADHVPWWGDAAPVLEEVERFLVPKGSTRLPTRPGPAVPLSRRERQVMELACTGASAKDISRLLFISERTVETHIANGYQKLGIRSRIELVQRQRSLGLGAAAAV